MDFRTYQQFRSYCCDDLRDYLDFPGYDDVRKLWGKLNGQVGLIQREQQLALSLHQCSDLTPRERAAAELLAAISNHRVIAWQREPEPPNGNEPAPPLEKAEVEALANQTRDAVRRYAAFLPEPERDVLLADCEVTLEAVPVTSPSGGDIEQTLIDEKVRTNKKIWDDSKLKALWEESILPGVTIKSIAKKHGVSRQRIAALIKTAKNKLSTKNSWQNSQHPPQIQFIKGRKY